MQLLCATDFSKPASAAADIAAALARGLKLPLRLLHCGQEWLVMGELPVVQPDDASLAEQLKREADRLRAATGVEVIEDCRRGSASCEIIAAAAETPTKMIVVGSVGNGRADRWLIGSVAERVAESASVPTLVVRQPETLLTWLAGSSALRMFCGVDFTASADIATAATQPFLDLGKVEIDAAHVRPAEYPSVSQDEQLQRQRDVWERMRKVLGDVSVKVHICYAADHPPVEFLHKAEEENAGLVVVGTHQRHGLQRLLSPSFSRSVLAHAKTNVLCVPVCSGKPDLRIPTIRRVLLATNFTEVCTEALRYARSILPCGGSIHILHVAYEITTGINPVISSEVYFDHGLASAKLKADAALKMKQLPPALLAAPGVAITTEVFTASDIPGGICETADRIGADVICMGSTGHSRTGAALLGSTVDSVIARAHRPVFVATPPRV